MQRFIKLDQQDQPLPDDAPFENVGGILVKHANVIVAPFLLNDGQRANYADAVKIADGCAHLDKRWRLPEVEELFLIPDRSKYNPAIDTNFFPFLADGGWAWSNTKDASVSSYAWYVYFSYGHSYYGAQSNGALVLAVRSASQ